MTNFGNFRRGSQNPESVPENTGNITTEISDLNYTTVGLIGYKTLE